MKISLRESKGFDKDFDLEKVLLATGWLPAQQVTGMTSYSCIVLAMYDGNYTVEVAFGDEGVDIFEYATKPENVCAMYEAGEAGYYDWNSTWDDTISFVNRDTGEETEFAMCANTSLSPAEALSMILRDYYL